MLAKKKIAKTAAATFGAALATLNCAPELQADIVDLTFSPGSVPFNSTSTKSAHRSLNGMTVLVNPSRLESLARLHSWTEFESFSTVSRFQLAHFPM